MPEFLRRWLGALFDTSDSGRSLRMEVTAIAAALGVFGGVGLLAVFFTPARHTHVALLWAFAAGAAGFLGGFLFGIPRALTNAGEGGAKPVLQVNTNLEQVSDWLTKIIAGLGLVNLKQVPDYVQRLAYYAAGGFSSEAGAQARYEHMAAAVLVYFATLGFVGGYLLTRTYLSQVFRAADSGTIGLAPQDARVLQAEPLEADGKRVEMPMAMKAALDELRRKPVDKVKQDAESLEAWARAHFDAGQMAEAIEGYRRAVDMAPANARLRYAYAIALKYGGRPQVDVIAHLGEAVRLARNEPDLALKERVYVSYTYNALFLPGPEGYQKARQAGEEYVRTAGNRASAEVWINLACSWGQEAAAVEGSRDEARGRVIEALGEVLKIDAGWTPRLQSLVAGMAGGDDDLAFFSNDNAVRAAVGLPVA